MKILFTFEHGDLAVHSIDIIRMLKHRGHELFFYEAGSKKLHPYYWKYLGFDDCAIFINTLTNVNEYDIWIYDLTSWDSPQSPLISKMESFKGKLICTCNNDGADFLHHRTSDLVRDKTSLFMRNTLFLDRTKYHSSIVNKLFVSTCYISNSQDFKYSAIPFREKQKRAIFTGSLTGFSEDGNPDRFLCRIKIPMALINAGIPCIYRLHNYNPQWKEKFEENVPAEYKTFPLSRPDFIEEMEHSMIVLALRGNYHTVNRFYEGLASGALVFTTKFRDAAEFYGHGDPGVHYVEIEWDGSDVVEKTKYYFEHLDEAERIAINGRKLWEEYSMWNNNKLLPPKVIDYYVKGIKEIGGIDI